MSDITLTVDEVTAASSRLRDKLLWLEQLTNVRVLNEFLIHADARGWPGFPRRCPLSVYLTQLVGAPVSVYSETTRVNDGHGNLGPRLWLPTVARTLVSALDRGLVPELVADDYPEQLRKMWFKERT